MPRPRIRGPRSLASSSISQLGVEARMPSGGLLDTLLHGASGSSGYHARAFGTPEGLRAAPTLSS
jgi:hypothetical protein